jgi:caa(3)-type oxidase subunit IV
MERQAAPHEQAHPGPAVYVYVALVLAVVTAIEVAVIYQSLAQALMVGILFLLSAGKFALVAMFFMHLRYDARIFSVFFIGGLMLATAVLTALLTLFGIIGT